jgi:hypothetical protein
MLYLGGQIQHSGVAKRDPLTLGGVAILLAAIDLADPPSPGLRWAGERH